MVKIVLMIWMVLGLAAAGWCGHFKDNGNGTVTDLATGLIWQQDSDNVTREWSTAGVYCQELSLGGNTNWRLPNIKELESIVDYRVSPSVDTSAFSENTSYFWSATTDASESGNAWTVVFTSGKTDSFSKSSHFFYSRCVR